MNIDQLYEHFSKIPLGISKDSDDLISKLFLSNLEFIHSIRLDLRQDQLLNFLRGDIVDKWFVYTLLDYVNILPLEFCHLFCNALLGLDNTFSLTQGIYKSLVRIFGYDILVNSFLNIFESTDSSLIKFYVLENLRHIDLSDLIEISEGSIIILAKARYSWNRDSYKIERIACSKIECNKYEQKINEVFLRKYETVLNCFINNQNNNPLIQLSRFLFPRKENCPIELISLYKRAMSLGLAPY